MERELLYIYSRNDSQLSSPVNCLHGAGDDRKSPYKNCEQSYICTAWGFSLHV